MESTRAKPQTLILARPHCIYIEKGQTKKYNNKYKIGTNKKGYSISNIKMRNATQLNENTKFVN